MASIFHSILLTFLLTTLGSCSVGRQGHGLIGYGIIMYKPNCAYSCRAAISTSALNCSEAMDDDMEGMEMSDMSGMTETSSECYASDDAFLQTLAYCVSTKCHDLPDWKKEQWWAANVAGRDEVQPLPKESYRQALDKVVTPPTREMVSGDLLNGTLLVNEADYTSNWNAQDQFEKQEILHERYGLVLLLTGFVVPVGLSLLRFIPFPGALITRFNAWIIVPPVWGTRHQQPFAGGLGLVPTRGQALFIAYLIIINVILCSVQFHSSQPNAWEPDDARMEVMLYVANRAGVLSFANIPLLILYSSRNNILLKVTNWSHSTFLLLHRWVATIATIQAVLHSLIYLRQRIETHQHATESKLPYWYWGIIATLSMSILLPSSVLVLRKKMYELFLGWHVFLSIMTIVGCYYHIIYRFQNQWGYETWVYVAMAVWGFDRVMRVLRLFRNGIKTAIVTKVDDDYVRVDIPGVTALGHAYLYFPTLTWRIWENHPFSVASAIMPQQNGPPKVTQDEETGSLTTKDIDISPELHKIPDSEKNKTISSTIHSRRSTSLGLTFLLRRQSGLTAMLASRISLPVLIESSYGNHEDLSEYSYLIGIAGGVGITAVIPYLRSHAGLAKLYWGVRGTAIIDATEEMIPGGVEKVTVVGERMDLRKIVVDAVEEAGTQGVAIVVSGPPTMADEVRVLVSKIGKSGRANLKLVDEAFSW